MHSPGVTFCSQHKIKHVCTLHVPNEKYAMTSCEDFERRLYYLNFILFTKKFTSGVLWRPLAREEVLVATLWHYLTATPNVHVAVRRE